MYKFTINLVREKKMLYADSANWLVGWAWDDTIEWTGLDADEVCSKQSELNWKLWGHKMCTQLSLYLQIIHTKV